MLDFCPVHREGYQPWRRSRLLNAWVDNLSMSQLLERLDEGILFTLNPDHLYHLQRDPEFAAAYCHADFVTSDSKYVFWSLGLLGRRIQAKVSGSDIVPAFWRHHLQNPDIRIYLLGARQGIAQAAQQRINGQAGRPLVVGAHGPSMNFVNNEAEISAVIDNVNASGANVLIVGLGAPKQEIWIVRHRSRMPGIRIYMGVGATIDYEAEAVRRAPRWMTQNGLEWVYRMATEPRRYWRRYFRTLEFVWLVLLDACRLYLPPPFPAPATAGPSSEGTLDANSAAKGGRKNCGAI